MVFYNKKAHKKNPNGGIPDYNNKVFKNKSNSTVKFNGDYEDTLEKVLEEVQTNIEERLVVKMKIESIITGRNFLKIKIKDPERMIERTINCVFRYDNEDKWFGNCHIEFNTTEKSQKPRLYYVGMYKLSDKARIIEKIIVDLEYKIEEIY